MVALTLYAAASDRRGQRSHAAELRPGGQDGAGGSSGGSSGCTGATFAMQITFDPLPSRVRDELPEHDPGRDAERADTCNGYTHDIDWSGTMTGRDRIVIVVIAALAVAAAAWLLVVSPEREKASKLGAEVSTAQSQLTTAEGEVNAARGAEAGYPTEYTSLVNLGKAVPTGQEVPSLIVQLAQATNEKNVEFTSITSGGSGSSSGAARGGLGRLHRDAVHVRVQRQLLRPVRPLSAAQPFHRAHERRQPASQRPPAHDPGGPTGPGRVLRLRHVQRSADGDDHCDRVRAPREPGRERGATATSPTGAQTTSGSAASSPATPAVIGAAR